MTVPVTSVGSAVTAFVLVWAVLALAGTMSLPSRHRFRPAPGRPSECAICGRRRAVHVEEEPR